MKKFISFMLIVACMIVNFQYKVVASGLSYITGLKSSIDAFVDVSNPTEQQTIQILDGLMTSGGFMGNFLNSQGWSPIIKYMASQIDVSQADATMQENIACIKESLENGYSSDGNNIVISDSFKTALVNTGNYFSSNQGYDIGYTYDLVGNGSYFGTKYVSLCEITEQYQDNYNVLLSGNNLYLVSKNNFKVLYDSNYPGNYFITYNAFLDGSLVTLKWAETYKQFVFNYNADVNAFVEQEYPHGNSIVGSFISSVSDNNIGYNNFYSGYQYILTYGKRESYKIYRNMASVPSDGKAPYYYNNTVWQDFSTSQGDYTFSPSNINTVTYGDVINYQDQYYDDHGYYPDQSQVITYIDNKNEENISNDNSGGDDSGGGSDDDSTNIFDWLKNLGKVLGDLIRGVGNFLTEIVGGLVDAINNLLSSIGGLISGTLENLTNIFSGLISFVYSGLPEEVQALMMLGLSFALLITVIDLIRK